jgi:lipoprotein NlpI
MKIYFLLLSLCTLPLLAHPLPEAERQELLKVEKANLEKCNAVLKDNPKSVRALSIRGDAKVFLHDWPGALADYEEMIRLDPSQDVPHWRLGIVYFFLGKYEKGAAQFAKYHAYGARDRENGVWHFFCLAKVKGVEAARKEMLAYTQFDRHPFPDVYSLLEAKIDAAELQKRQEKRHEATGRQEEEQFFVDLYLGMHAWLEKKPELAEKHLAAATANRWGREESGKTYMWQVARLLHDEWAKPAKK